MEMLDYGPVEFAQEIVDSYVCRQRDHLLTGGCYDPEREVRVFHSGNRLVWCAV